MKTGIELITEDARKILEVTRTLEPGVYWIVNEGGHFKIYKKEKA